MKAVIHKTGAIGEVLGIERCDGIDYVYFEGGLCKLVSEVGFLLPYHQYEEETYDWLDFRREAAKGAMCAMIQASTDECYPDPNEICCMAIEYADELIKQLKEEKK